MRGVLIVEKEGGGSGSGRKREGEAAEQRKFKRGRRALNRTSRRGKQKKGGRTGIVGGESQPTEFRMSKEG